MRTYRGLAKIGKVVFTYEDIAKALGISLASARVEASRFVKYGLIIRIKRNMYVRREDWLRFDREDFFYLANLLQVPSYVSLTSALSYYGLTTQVQREFVESVCIYRSKEVSIEEWTFLYVKVKRPLYFGFERKGQFFIAYPEKAFLDCLYLRSLGRYDFDISSLDLHRLDWKRVRKWVKAFPEKVQDEVKEYEFETTRTI